MTPPSLRNSLVSVSGVKWVLDGTPIEQLAFRRTPYPNRAGWYGRLNFSVSAVRAILTDALTTKEPLLLHITGDSTTAVVLTLMESMGSPAEWQPLRVRIEHANGITGTEVERARRLGIVIAQPRAGAPFRTWRNAGIPVAYGSDTSPNPFVDLAAITTAAGNAAETISRVEAMWMYTRGSAFAEFTERDKGALAPGMVADLAVLSADILAVPAAELATTTSVLTLVGGRVAYDSGVLQLSRAAHRSPEPRRRLQRRQAGPDAPATDWLRAPACC